MTSSKKKVVSRVSSGSSNAGKRFKINLAKSVVPGISKAKSKSKASSTMQPVPVASKHGTSNIRNVPQPVSPPSPETPKSPVQLANVAVAAAGKKRLAKIKKGFLKRVKQAQQNFIPFHSPMPGIFGQPIQPTYPMAPYPVPYNPMPFGMALNAGHMKQEMNNLKSQLNISTVKVEAAKEATLKATANLNTNPAEIIDTTDSADLGGNSFLISQSSRKSFLWFLLISTIAIVVMQLLLAFIGFYQISQLIQPFSKILTADESSESSSQVRSQFVSLVVFWILFNIFRIILLQKVLEMEDEDYQKKPSSWPFTIIVWVSFVVTIFSIIILYKMSSDIAKTTFEFDKLFMGKAINYSTDAEIMRQMDRMHRTFQCCGADKFESWFKVDLYKPLLEDKWKKESEIYLKWAEKCKKKNESITDNLVANDTTIGDTNIQTIYGHLFKLNSLPASCCKHPSKGICTFYNFENFDYWTIPQDAMHDAILKISCQQKVSPALVRLGLKIEVFLYLGAIFEFFIMFILSCFLQSAFESHYENHHRPSVGLLPVGWIVVGSITFLCIYIWLLRFFSFYDAFIVINNLFSEIPDKRIDSILAKNTKKLTPPTPASSSSSLHGQMLFIFLTAFYVLFY